MHTSRVVLINFLFELYSVLLFCPSFICFFFGHKPCCSVLVPSIIAPTLLPCKIVVFVLMTSSALNWNSWAVFVTHTNLSRPFMYIILFFGLSGAECKLGYFPVSHILQTELEILASKAIPVLSLPPLYTVTLQSAPCHLTSSFSICLESALAYCHPF